ncbi:MAG: hypothetical protein JXB18_12325 [Sedimentisphaerales bacterium]|nr:hypothetical protein [Sedimentisphaerales bacterium]
MSKRKLYLHIGAGKTGTSALQQFFFQNRAVLESHHILYPEIGIHQFAHHGLATSCYEPKERQFFMPDSNILPLEDYLEQVIALDGDVLLSSEYLWHGRHAFKLVSLCEHFDVKIIAYVRRQDDLLMSRYNQHMKVTGEPFQNVLYYLPKVEHAMNYELVLGRWEKQFGREAIVVRPYEKQQFYGQSLFGDFLHHVLGLDLTADYQLPKKDINPRLSRDAMTFMHIVYGLGLGGDVRDRLVGALLKYSTTLGQESEVQSDKHGMLSPRERLSVIEKYARINETVARLYMGREDGRLFYNALPDLQEEYVPYTGLTPEAAHAIIAFIRGVDPDLYRMIDGAIASSLPNLSDEKRQSLKLLSGFESMRAVCSPAAADASSPGLVAQAESPQAAAAKRPVMRMMRRWRGYLYYAWILLLHQGRAKQPSARDKKENLP